MTFASTGSASATTLVTLSSGGGGIYSAGTTIHATLKKGTSAQLKDTSGNTITTCTSSTIEMLTGNETGTWVSGPVLDLRWEGCSQLTRTISQGRLEIMVTSGVNGEVVGNFNSVTVGIFGVSCTYGTGGGTKLGTLAGGEEPTLTIGAVLGRVEGGFLCPSTVSWNAEYIITAPHSVFVAT